MSGSEDESLWDTTAGDGIESTRKRRLHVVHHPGDEVEGA